MTKTDIHPPAAAKPVERTRRPLLTVIGPGNLSLIGALVIVVAVFGALNPGFLDPANLAGIGEAVTVFGLLAVVQTVVIICGGLDISVGSQAGIASVVSAMAFTATGGNALLGFLAALAVGVAAGAVNGLIIVYGRVNPVIATLATLAAYKGVAQLISGGKAQGFVLDNDFFIFLARGKVLGLPVPMVILILVSLGLHFLLKYTDIGRNIYAIGGNDTAARLAGININKYLVAVFVLAGVVAAIAGIILTARTGSGQPVSGSEGLELKAITAAALGGCALKGGKGTIGGTLLAVVLLGALDNGLNVVGVNTFWQNVAQGFLLAAAVVIQQRRSGERAVGLPT
ncbi:ribose transport system permease protein [Actinokineospora alba]|uniref:Ribose transport system permease protein n=1 Tax=Actinokineospora alba TaxID=504798 RepID=A0A1H0NM34_9PSEU|nr:ABC transporter permease [Actinokineospora alba]TDP68770.1 ribose transport system permease protein [Actinokineospora alba]SDH86303.1 ribose transport system permease protein [Actinokineospora alba]SDO93797.1 ribose transport system permease protein [Actinokineospora alba]